VQGIWRSRRAVSLHVALAIFIPACVALTWWQVARAVGGNTLSWVYTFEWPIFGGYATYMWWKLVHDEPVAAPSSSAAGPLSDGALPTPHGPVAARGTIGPAGSPGPDADQDADNAADDELAAYNRYLADLNASGRQKRW